MPKGFNETLKELAAQYNARKVFEPLFKMEEAEYRQVDMPVVSAMDDDHILATADKIGAVLEHFYSLHEVDELTRIITDPDKGVEDVKAAMSVIFQRNKAKEEDMVTIAEAIKAAVIDKDEAKAMELVKSITSKYPLYA